MVVYIVKGIEQPQDDEPISIVSKYAVRSNLESARNELKEVAKEILNNAKENGIEVVENDIDEDRIYIELSCGDICDYEIIEREVLD